jgi:hypothetical protein
VSGLLFIIDGEYQTCLRVEPQNERFQSANTNVQ